MVNLCVYDKVMISSCKLMNYIKELLYKAFKHWFLLIFVNRLFFIRLLADDMLLRVQNNTFIPNELHDKAHMIAFLAMQLKCMFF